MSATTGGDTPNQQAPGATTNGKIPRKRRAAGKKRAARKQAAAPSAPVVGAPAAPLTRAQARQAEGKPPLGRKPGTTVVTAKPPADGFAPMFAGLPSAMPKPGAPLAAVAKWFTVAAALWNSASAWPETIVVTIQPTA